MKKNISDKQKKKLIKKHWKTSSGKKISAMLKKYWGGVKIKEDKQFTEAEKIFT